MRLFSLLATFLCFTAAGAHENPYRVETYTGQQIAPYTDKIVQLSNTLFKGHPYFYNGTDADYTKHLQSYAQSNNRVLSLAYEGNQIIGMATGLPLNEAEKAAQEPFLKKGENISKTFYLEELIVLPEHTGKGIGQQMTKNVEKYAKEKGYTSIATQAIDEGTVKSAVPNGYYSMTNVFKKLNWQERSELNTTGYWPNTNETQNSPHKLIYWTKSL